MKVSKLAVIAACATLGSLVSDAKATIVFDSISNATSIYSFNSGLENQAGQVMVVPTADANCTLTGLNIDAVVTGTTGATNSYTDLQLVVTLFQTWVGATVAFSGSLGSTTFDFGATALPVGYIVPITGLTLAAPVTIAGTEFCAQYTWYSSAGVACTNLETGQVLSATVAPAIGSNPITTGSGSKAYEVFYDEAGATDGVDSIPASGGAYFSGYKYDNEATQWIASVPEPVSAGFLAPAALLLGRRRRQA
jgi:hypothetical protein